MRTFGNFDIQIRMSSVIGSAVMRQLKLIYEHFQGVAPLGLIRTEVLRLSGGLQDNEFDNFAADTALMSGLARWGELHRLPLELYRKRVTPKALMLPGGTGSLFSSGRGVIICYGYFSMLANGDSDRRTHGAVFPF